MSGRLVIAVCALSLAPFLVSCGDDGGGTAAAATSPSAATPGGGTAASGTPAAASTAAPRLPGPASQYSVSIDDLGLNWITEIRSTFVIDAASYAKSASGSTGPFASEAEGMKLLKEWGYGSGYQTAYRPEGGDQAVLTNGSYYIQVETHIFNDVAGAQAAYTYFAKYVGSTRGLQPVSTKPLGNQFASYVATLGKIGNSSVNATYYHIVFRRGNLVTVVLTKGAEGLTRVDDAWGVANMADEKALGKRTPVVPTPTSNFQTPTPTPKP
jgi:hypothetical protein